MFTNFFGTARLPVSARVKNGISFLNEYFKGNSWTKKINLGKLDLSSGDKCIIGQVFEKCFGKVQENIKLSDKDCEEYGFIAYGFYGFNLNNDKIYFEDCKALKREWVKQILVTELLSNPENECK